MIRLLTQKLGKYPPSNFLSILIIFTSYKTRQNFNPQSYISYKILLGFSK
jgi:hypothetical protein